MIVKNKMVIFSSDFVYNWTAVALILPAIFFIFIRLVFLESALSCFIPAHLTVSAGHFLHEECWVKEKYSSPFPKIRKFATQGSDQETYDVMTSPHAWFPWLLILFFFLFTIPQVLRHIAKRNLCRFRSSSEENGGKHLAAELVQIIEELSSQKSRTVYFLVLKAVVFVNFLFQLLYLVATFRDQNGNTTENNSLNSSIVKVQTVKHDRIIEAFPKNLICLAEVVIRQPVNSRIQIHSYAVHCSVPLNDVYHYYCILLCLWFGLSAILSFGSFVCYSAFCYYGDYTRFVFSRILPKEEVREIFKNIQGTDGLYVLWDICRKEDVNTIREVIQILKGSLITTRQDGGRSNQRDKKSESMEIPEVVVTPQCQLKEEVPTLPIGDKV